MNGVGLIERTIEVAVTKYALALQEELEDKYAEEFRQKLDAKRMEITAHVVGSLSVHEDIARQQIVIQMR